MRPAASLAHDSPEHEIEALSRTIAAKGATAELLARRATEWRALGKYDAAANDLKHALAIKSNSIPLLLDYANVELERGNVCNAEAVTRIGLTHAAETERAPLHMMLAEAAERRGAHELALKECEQAMSLGEPQLEWHLTHARLLYRLAKHGEAATMLQAAYEKTPNIVLEIEWIETMIDAGLYHEAMARIMRYSGRGRWRSAWLIRQARAELGLSRGEAAERNLKAALSELAQRINLEKIDATLLADRAMAQLLRGKRDAAAEDIDRLRGALRGRVPGGTLIRLELLFGERK